MKFIPKYLYSRIAHRQNLVKILGNIGWLLLDKVLRMGMGLLLGVWIARYLGPDQFGVLSFALAFVGLFGAIGSLGLPSIVVRNIIQSPNSSGAILCTAGGLQIFSGLIAYLCIVLTIFWLRPEDQLVIQVVAILGLTMMLKFCDIAIWWFESQVQSKYVVKAQNVVFLAFSIFKIGLILNNGSIVVFAWTMLAETAAASTFVLTMMLKRGPRFAEYGISFIRAKELLKDSWPLMLSGITITIYMKIDQIMIGQMLGDDAVGVFSAAARISEVWYFIPTAVVISVFPSLMDAKKISESQYDLRLQKLYQLMVIISVSVALPISFLANTLIGLLYGESYFGAGTVLAIHVWGSVFVFLGVASSNWFVLENKQMLALQRTMLGALVNVILNFIFIPKYGINGAAFSLVISQCVASFLSDCLNKNTRKMFLMKLISLNPFSWCAFVRSER